MTGKNGTGRRAVCGGIERMVTSSFTQGASSDKEVAGISAAGFFSDLPVYLEESFWLQYLIVQRGMEDFFEEF
ncbi:MAG: hypothetical protein ACLUOI_09855 [Eisenbergiella sp.]